MYKTVSKFRGVSARRAASACAVATVLALAAAGCSSGSTGDAEEGDKRVQAQLTASMPNLPQLVAAENDLYAKNGVDVEGIEFSDAQAISAALASGEVDIITALPDFLIAQTLQGADQVTFGKMSTVPQFDLLVSNSLEVPGGGDSWMDAMRALEGKRIGVVARGTGAENLVRTLFEYAGVDPDAQVYIATGLPATTLASMSSNNIDAAMTFEPGLTQAEENGIGYRPFSVRNGEGPDELQWPGTILVTSNRFAEAEPEALRGYVDALNEALEFIKDEANRDEVVAIMVERLSLDEPLAEALYERDLDKFPDVIEYSDDEVSQLENADAWSSEVGLTEGSADIANLVIEP